MFFYSKWVFFQVLFWEIITNYLKLWFWYAVLMSLESMNEETENSIVKLLKFFADTIVVTPDQMKNVSLNHCN